MRHVLLPGAPATAARPMVHATAAARLVALAGGALGLTAGLQCTAAGTINLAAVAAAADEHQDLAASAQELTARVCLRLSFAQAWTTSATGGILPRHACSARGGHGVGLGLAVWVVAVPALPIRQVVAAPLCARYTPQRCDRASGTRGPVDMWARKGVAHISTGPASSSQRQSDCLERQSSHPAGDCQPRRSPHVTG
jgi:hypothetical protein